MSLSDKFRSILKKNQDSGSSSKDTPKEKPETPAPISKKPPLEDFDKLISKEKAEGEKKLQGVEQELETIRASLENLDVTSRTKREAQGQNLEFLQQEAEREIKSFERRLQEDMKHWDKKLKEREKILQQTRQEAEGELLGKKTSHEQSETGVKELAERAEALLKEQEVKLREEQEKWKTLLSAKESELVSLKQELTRREADLDKEFKKQESQRATTQELWQSRLKELERQWIDKRKNWEDAMKVKEQERVRLNAAFQEKQSTWSLEQERRIQEISLRQERAEEKLSALKDHHVKEMQNWQELTKSREEQIQQLKVKLLLSESEGKGQLDEVQKGLQETVSQLTGQIQTLQGQIRKEEDSWQKHMTAKDKEMAHLKTDIQSKLRKMETDFMQRMTALQSQKDAITAEYARLEADYQQAQARYAEETNKGRDERAALESAHQARLADLKARTSVEISALETQSAELEKQRAEAEKEMESARVRWREELQLKEKFVKEAQEAIASQEAEFHTRNNTSEELLTRQVEALRVKQRAIERDLARACENIAKAEKDQATQKQALQEDFDKKDAERQSLTDETTARLKKRLDERRLALEAFQLMRKDEDARAQKALRIKENERAELTTRLKTLPKDLEDSLRQKAKAVEHETAQIRKRLTTLEEELAQAREQSRVIVLSKATELSGLRQTLEQKEKEIASDVRSREQVLESERAEIEKKMTAAQGEVDRTRANWQENIDKKEKEIEALQTELQKQEISYRETLELEQVKCDEQLKPLFAQQTSLNDALVSQQAAHDAELARLEQEKATCKTQIKQTTENEHTEKAALETRFRQERAQWKARLETLTSEREGAQRSGKDVLVDKEAQIQHLEEQISAQAVAHETRRRELIHQATLKSRTLQDVIRHMEQELASAEELLPKELEARAHVIVELQTELAELQKRHARTVARFERALTTLTRHGQEKETSLRHALAATQEEWAKKLTGRDSEIAALQSNLIAKEAERQGELDRLAKQFAEERFQLEKSKEELEWKLKDRKEVAERQLAARQKEIQALENEIHRVKTQRDQDIAQKSGAFEAEKQKVQSVLESLRKQLEQTRQTQESALAAKDLELQTLLAHSKEHLKALSEEFTQKVGSWRGTNDTLRGHIEQLKAQAAQAQEHWEGLRKEKATELGAMRQELSQWEAKIKNDTEEFDRTLQEERTSLNAQIRKSENALLEATAHFEQQHKLREDEMVRATEQIHEQEENMEAQWHAALEQWQTDKESLQQQKLRLEQDLVQMQNRFQADLRQTEEAMVKLKMEITFKETHTTTQKQRLEAQMQRDLDPLRNRLSRLTNETENEQGTWEARLRAKDDELKTLKARLALREKRLQEENRRRSTELEHTRKQLAQETERARTIYENERTRLEKLIIERRSELARLNATQSDTHKSEVSEGAHAVQAAQKARQQLEDSLRQILAERDSLRTHYEPLLMDKQKEVENVQIALDESEANLSARRDHAKEETQEMRKRTEVLRLNNRQRSTSNAPSTAAAWNSFEEGVRYYQGRQWAEAAHAFERCLENDTRWGAAYQYLALCYQAQGDKTKALEIAARAKDLDPANTQLASWVERLQASINEQKAS